jgi:hypothetical protein
LPPTKPAEGRGHDHARHRNAVRANQLCRLRYPSVAQKYFTDNQDPRVLAFLATHLTSTDFNKYAKAIDLLGCSKNPDAFALLFSQLDNIDRKMRWRAAVAFAEFATRHPHPRVITPLVALAGDIDRIVVFYAVVALGRLRAVSAFPALLAVLTRLDVNTQLFDLTIEALAYIGNPRAIEPIRAVLHQLHQERYIGRRALCFLAWLGDDRVLPDVRAITENTDWNEPGDATIYHAAIIGLTHLGEEDAYMQLLQERAYTRADVPLRPLPRIANPNSRKRDRIAGKRVRSSGNQHGTDR